MRRDGPTRERAQLAGFKRATTTCGTDKGGRRPPGQQVGQLRVDRLVRHLEDADAGLLLIHSPTSWLMLPVPPEA